MRRESWAASFAGSLTLLMITEVALHVPPVSAQRADDSSNGRPIMERSDREIPKPKPVTLNGTRFEAVRNGRMRGFDQSGGIIAAIDEKSGKELWILQVYALTFDHAEERDTQEVFITRLRVGADAKHLEVTNERKQVFIVDLFDRSVAVAKKS
jgi:hypothetical protein